MSIRGKHFHVRRGGQEKTLPPVISQDPRTGEVQARSLVNIVIIKAGPHLSKTFYVAGYNPDGNYTPPDCASANGVVPDANIKVLPDPKMGGKQNDDCPSCPHNRFNTAKQGRGKACQDNKRLAVVPYPDMKNAVDGGPMLLRLPPSAFSGLAELQAQLLQQGYRYYGVIMQVSFDESLEFPLPIFTPIGVLNDHEVTEVLAMQESPIVDLILGSEEGGVLDEPVESVQTVPAQPQPVQQAIVTSPPPQSNGAEPSKPAPSPSPVTSHAGVHNAPAAQPVAPVETPEQTIARLQAEIAARDNPPPPPPETPEQTIARLKAELAAKATTPTAAPAAEVAAKPRKRGRPRSQVVTPAGSPPAQPAAAVAAKPAQETAPTSEDADEGDIPPDLDARIDQLLRPSGS